MQNPSQTCPQCQSPIPADAPGGLCPACVWLGVAGPTNLSQATAANAPTIEEVAGFCDVYETFLCVCPSTAISFEHAWYLGQVLRHGDEYVLAACPTCRALWIRDRLSVIPNVCAGCRVSLPSEPVQQGC